MNENGMQGSCGVYVMCEGLDVEARSEERGSPCLDELEGLVQPEISVG